LDFNEFFFFSSLFPLFSTQISHLPFSKIKCVLSFYVCINFGPYSFNCYLFFFSFFSKLIFFNFIPYHFFHLIFVFDLVLILILLIDIFFYSFLDYFLFFNSVPHYFLFNYDTRFGPFFFVVIAICFTF